MPIRSHGLRWVFMIAACVIAVPLFDVVADSAASASSLPNACSVLAAVQPQNTIAGGKHVAVGKPKTTSSTATDKACSESVGAITVYLDFSKYAGGFGGVKITSRTHPTGLGTGDELIVGTGLGSGGPVDFVNFHKGGIYASVSANGSVPSNLVALAREVYKQM